MARRYVVSFENVTVSAAQDLISVKGSTGKSIRLISVKVGATDTTLPTAQMLQLRVQFLPVTVTAGSGGGAATPRLLDPGDSAAAATARINDTTPATSSGTAVTIHTAGVHIYAGEDYTFPAPPVAGLNQQFSYGLLSTVTGTVHLSGNLEFEELGL